MERGRTQWQCTAVFQTQINSHGLSHGTVLAFLHENDCVQDWTRCTYEIAEACVRFATGCKITISYNWSARHCSKLLLMFVRRITKTEDYKLFVLGLLFLLNNAHCKRARVAIQIGLLVFTSKTKKGICPKHTKASKHRCRSLCNEPTISDPSGDFQFVKQPFKHCEL
jgi:hypothetical protein